MFSWFNIWVRVGYSMQLRTQIVDIGGSISNKLTIYVGQNPSEINTRQLRHFLHFIEVKYSLTSSQKPITGGFLNEIL